MNSNNVIEWLLDDENPAVKYRTQTEILGISGEKEKAKEWIFSKLPKDWYETKGMWYGYYITALAEAGLTKDDIPCEYLDKAIDIINNEFACACSDFLLLRALIMLGCHDNEVIQNILHILSERSLPDGGFLCKLIGKKFKYVPKSCYKANLCALLCLSECSKKGINPSYGPELIQYFLKRDIFYKSDKKELVIGGAEGWRTIDVFHPFEPMRVGIHNIVEAFSALGYGNNQSMNEAWNLMYRNKDENGKLLLAGTLTKSYLPKEKVGKPSKWATFYMVLAETEKHL